MTARGWVRSSHCQDNGCLRVRRLPSGSVVIGSTTTGESIVATSVEFAAFLAGVRAGEFDEVPS